MSKFIKKGIRSVVAVALVLAMVFVFPLSIIASGTPKLNYVSIGDSMSNGYGFSDYYPSEGAYKGKNLRGFLVDQNHESTNGNYATEAYPALFYEMLGGKSSVNWTQLSASAFRVNDVVWFLTGAAEDQMDDYSERVFASRGDTKDDDDLWGEQWSEVWNNQYNSGNGNPEAFVTKTMQDAIAAADVITLNIGYNNFGTFLTGRLMNIGGSHVDKDTLQDSLDMMGRSDIQVESIYEEICNIISKVGEEFFVDYMAMITGYAAKADEYIDLLLHGFVDYCYYYAVLTNYIYTVNPDADVIVIGLSNTQKGLVGTYNGQTIDLGAVYGKLIDLANTYVCMFAPNCNKYAYVDPANYDLVSFYDVIAEGGFGSSTDTKVVQDAILGQLYGIIKGLTVEKLGFAKGNALESVIKDWNILDAVINLIILKAYGLVDFSFEGGQFAITPNITNTALICRLLTVNGISFSATQLSDQDYYMSLVVNLMTAIITSGRAAMLLGPSDITYSEFVDLYKGDVAFSTNAIYQSVHGVFKTVFDAIFGFISASCNVAIDMNALLAVVPGFLANSSNYVALLKGIVSKQDLMNIVDDIDFSGILSGNFDISTALANNADVLTPIMGLVQLYVRYLIGEGVACHPATQGHKNLAKELKRVYDDYKANGTTARQYGIQMIVDHLKEYFDEYTKAVQSDVKNVFESADSIFGFVEAYAGTFEDYYSTLKYLSSYVKEQTIQFNHTISDFTQMAAENFFNSHDDAIIALNDAHKQLKAVVANPTATAADVYAVIDIMNSCIDNLLQVTKDAQFDLECAKNAAKGEALSLLNTYEFSLAIIAVYDSSISAGWTEYTAQIAVALASLTEGTIASLTEKESLGLTEAVSNFFSTLTEYEMKYVENKFEFLQKVFGGSDNVIEKIVGQYDAAFEALMNINNFVFDNIAADAHTLVDSIEVVAAPYDAVGRVYLSVKALIEQAQYQIIAAKNAITSAQNVIASTGDALTAFVVALDEFVVGTHDSIEFSAYGINYIINDMDKETAMILSGYLTLLRDQSIELAYILTMLQMSATYGIYYLTDDSAIASLGDSVVTGFGFYDEGYYNYGYDAEVASAFPFIIGDVLDVDVKQLAMGSLRVEDILAILDPDYDPDAYFYSNIMSSIEEYAGDLDTMRAAYYEYIASSDLITINMGGNNFGTFFGSQIFSETPVAMSFDKYFEGADNTKFVALLGTLAIINQLSAYIPIDNSAVLNGLTIYSYVETLAYTALGAFTCYGKVLDKIHEINPNATIVVTGLYNTLDGLYYDDGSTYIDVGGIMDVFCQIFNLMAMEYCVNNAYAIYVDISDVEMFCDTDPNRPSLNLADGEYIPYMSYNSGIASHPSKAGHAYIAEQIMNSLYVVDLRTSYVGPEWIDGDGILTKDDATYLLHNIYNSEDYPIDESIDLDYNGDGFVDKDDATYLLHYIYNPWDYPLMNVDDEYWFE